MKTFLFDADGVVIVPPHRFMHYMKEHLPRSVGQSEAFFRGPFVDCLLGKADLKKAMAPFVADWGWPHSVEALMERWFAVEHNVNGPLLRVVQRLRAGGHYCGVATNQERYRLQYMADEMGLATAFDGMFGSAHVGAVKPDRAFYEQVTVRLGVPADSIVFWDDTKANVEAARSFGWHGEHFTGMAAFFDQLRRYVTKS